jgi:hypothetical protein
MGSDGAGGVGADGAAVGRAGAVAVAVFLSLGRALGRSTRWGATDSTSSSIGGVEGSKGAGPPVYATSGAGARGAAGDTGGAPGRHFQ